MDNPQAHLRLLSRNCRECIELVRRNEVDVAIIPERALPEELAFYLWRTYKAYLIMPKRHPLLRRGRPAIRDLLNESIVMRCPLIAAEMDDPGDQRVKEALSREGLPYNVRFQVGSLETVTHYVARGLGIAVISGICLSDEDNTSIEAIEIPKEFRGQTSYGVILRRDKHRTKLLKGLLPLIGIDHSDASAPGSHA